MRTMKKNNNETVMVIGIDHGYGNMKTATRCFPSGVARYDKEPIFQNNLLVYNDMYYQIGEEHKEFCAEKTQDEDYYVLTLAAIARELDGKGMNRAKVHIAAGLPLTWVATQKEDFQKYLLQNECVDFTFRNKEYHVPDTAHDCPILRIGVLHEQPVSERENLSKGEFFHFFPSLSLHHKTTVIYM